MGGGTSLTLKILVVHQQPPTPVELVGQTDQDHCSSTAGAAGVGEVGEVPVAAVVG